MPKKRRTKKKGTSRRRVGAMSPDSPILKVAGVAAGYLLGDKINGAITGAAGSIDPKIIAGVEAAAGAFLLFKKGKPSMVKSVGGGMLLGMGLKTGLKAFGVIGGYQNVPVIGRRMLSGYQNVPVIGGYTPGGRTAIGGYAINSSASNVMGSSSGSGRCRQD